MHWIPLKKIYIKYLLIPIGVLGVWLIYWDITENLNSYLHEIGASPLVLGIVIIILVGIFGIKVMK